MKYRLVRKYPGSPELGYETKFNNNGEDWNTPNMLIVADCKDFPEFWEEVKEPLFVTDDGISIFEGEDYIFVTEYWIAVTNTKGTLYHNTETRPRFKSKEAAQKYIEENKPIYSKKQIKEAIESSFVRETYFLDAPFCQIDNFKEDMFKQKLGI